MGSENACARPCAVTNITKYGLRSMCVQFAAGRPPAAAGLASEFKEGRNSIHRTMNSSLLRKHPQTSSP